MQAMKKARSNSFMNDLLMSNDKIFLSRLINYFELYELNSGPRFFTFRFIGDDDLHYVITRCHFCSQVQRTGKLLRIGDRQDLSIKGLLPVQEKLDLRGQGRRTALDARVEYGSRVIQHASAFELPYRRVSKGIPAIVAIFFGTCRSSLPNRQRNVFESHAGERQPFLLKVWNLDKLVRRTNLVRAMIA